jgi:protein-S-isoprenylcysteine O-methyltransferase Ste14
MSTNKDFKPKGTKRFNIPRWVILIYWPAGLLLVHASVPWGISFLSPRLGWTEARPGIINLSALILIAIGFSIVLWKLAIHFVRTPQRVEWERTPSYLLTHGLYQFSRNPMCLGELTLWLGWSVFFGSIPVLIAFFLLLLLLNYRVVPREESELEETFGDSYSQYKNRVPRWFGVPRA